MRALLRVFTALPFASEPRQGDAAPLSVSWSLAPVAGLGLGLVAYLTQQLTIEPVGPLASGALIVTALAAVTGATGLRSLAEVGLRLAHHDDEDEPPPARPSQLVSGQQFVVTLLIITQVTLLQRIHAAPQLLVMVPLAAVIAQALLLTDVDDVALSRPTVADRASIVVLSLLMAPLPLLLAGLSRTPFGFNGELAGIAGVWVAIAALAAGVVAGMLARAWALSRFGALDTAGWRVIGLTAETASLLFIAIRVA